MISAGLMNTLQVTVLVLVAAGATVVVRTRTRVRQVLALSVLHDGRVRVVDVALAASP